MSHISTIKQDVTLYPDSNIRHRVQFNPGSQQYFDLYINLFQILTHKPNKVAKTPFESLRYADHLLTFGPETFIPNPTLVSPEINPQGISYPKLVVDWWHEYVTDVHHQTIQLQLLSLLPYCTPHLVTSP